MKGIMIKDFYEGFRMKKNLASWILNLAVMVITSLIFRNEFGFLLVAAFICPLLGSSLLPSTVEQDEISEFNRIQLTWPIAKWEIILSKYMSGFIIQIMAFAVSFVWLLVYVYVFHALEFTSAVQAWGIGCGLSVIFFAVNYAAYFIMGNKKGTLLYLILFLILALSYILGVSKLGVTQILSLDKTLLTAIIMAAAVILMAGSYFLSLAIYTRKNS